MQAVRVAVVAFEGVSLFHLSVPGLVLGVEPAPAGLPPYEVRYCAPLPGLVRCSQGVVIDVPQGLAPMADAELVIVPAWNDPQTPAPAVLTDALRRAHERGAQVVGLCLGAFVLGDAGLLDGRQATTHWACRDLFARRFPKADFRPDVLYVDDGGVITSAGTVAAIDCCLNLVRERHGADVANRVARLLVTPPHRQGGQAQFIEQPVPELPSENRLPGVLEWARERLAEPLSLDVLADAAHMSRRTFTRRFREATGTTVLKWLAGERLARAQQLLETTDMPIEHIATAVGFGTSLSLRQQFAARFGTSPSSYRRAFFDARRGAPRLP
ncbi:GlxA family transcriptional regulator [Caldimonas tepidiphila]|uniref:GlxA family transcriptional regulator n=1 Tax=Caldimonas tepidiphila TaxID=2315841 RepID=UPI000E5A80A0|nr:helix-turn-helix domain-containing protein [Caldimonas tepidiphila]